MLEMIYRLMTTRDSNKQKACQTALYCPTSTQVIDFHLGLRLPSQNYTCPEGNGVEEYFRSRRSRGAFQKRCRQKVLSIEESAVVFIGIGSHISSLRWICRKNPQHRASVVSTKQIEDTFIREKPIWERPSYMESCFGERTRRTLQGGRVSMEDLFDWMQEETTPLALRVKVAWYVWSLRQVDWMIGKGRNFWNMLCSCSHTGSSLRKGKKSDAGFSAYGNDQKGLEIDKNSVSLWPDIWPENSRHINFKRFTFLHRGWQLAKLQPSHSEEKRKSPCSFHHFDKRKTPKQHTKSQKTYAFLQVSAWNQIIRTKSYVCTC